MKEITASQIKGIQIGQAQDEANATGCTVILCKEGMSAGVDVRGGGPATRETDLLHPKNMVQQIYGVYPFRRQRLRPGCGRRCHALSGRAWLRLCDRRSARPDRLRCSLFDLCVGNGKIRPDAAMGYAACKASEHNLFCDGNYGAGTGASVGKLLDAPYAMKSGQGMAGVQVGDHAGLRCGRRQRLRQRPRCRNARVSRRRLQGWPHPGSIIADGTDAGHDTLPMGNTTIGCIITNARLNKSQCAKIASIAHNGYADAIFPVHTMSDGDTIFTLAVNEMDAMPDVVGALAVHVMGKAINRAVLAAEAAYGLPSAASIRRIHANDSRKES